MDNDTLNQLKDEIERFKSSPIWNRYIVPYMQAMYASAAEDALSANDLNPVKFASGIAHAVKMISSFDDMIPDLKKAKESK